MLVCRKERRTSTERNIAMTIRSRRISRIAAAALVLSGAGIVGTSAAASASMGCGDHSFGFEGTRLLNDGMSNSAGPFAVSLPAGTYDITLHSFDDHAAHPGQVEQTQEQWYFTLDNGYVSPASTDIPDDEVFSSDTFSSVNIAEATAISVHHLGEGGVNSVAPMCVGFTAVEIVVPPAIERDVPVVEEPIIAGPVLPLVEAHEVPKIAVEVAPASLVDVPASAGPAPQLALTGPSVRTWALVVTGTVMLLAGIVLVFAEGRARPRF